MSGHVHVADPVGWVRGDDTTVRGTAFDDGERYDAAALHDRFAGVDTVDAVRRAVESLDGFYAVVRVVDGTVVAATDHVRSVPLFYAPDLGVVSDSARWLRERLDAPSMDAVAEAEYLTTTYVTGNETLYPGIRTLRAGELLVLDASGTVRTERHWTYAPRASADDPASTPTDRLVALDDALVAAFERCLAVADGRPVAVPLSGGYDSRLVASMLVRLGYDDVRTFTYGQADCADVRVAEVVAANLGLPWRRVEYTPDDWFRWFNSAERAAYYERADDFDAIPNLGAWPAVGELLDDGWLPEDALVVPGQTVVEIADHLPNRLLADEATGGGTASADAGDVTTDDFVESVLDRHYVHWNRDAELDRTFAARIRSVVDGLCDPTDLTSAYASWEWQERQAKFLCSDGRIYDHWGLDWWFPLWDPAVAAAWGAFPATARANKRRYVEFVETLYADVADVTPSEAARTQATDSRLTASVARLRSAAADSPLADLLRPLYRSYRTRTDTRASGPFGHLGVLSQSQFERRYAAERSHHTFRALEAVGRMSFAPAHECGWPGERLSVDALDRTRPTGQTAGRADPADGRSPTDVGECVGPTLADERVSSGGRSVAESSDD